MARVLDEGRCRTPFFTARRDPTRALDPAFTEEFLELLWGLEATVAIYPALESLLGLVVASPTFAAADLPSPTVDERAAPSAPSAPEDQPTLGLD